MAKWQGVEPSRWAALQSEKINEVRKRYAMAIFNSVVRRTPVDTGQARSNWIISVGEESNEFNAATITKRKITRGKNKGKTVTNTKLEQNLKQTMERGNIAIAFSGDDTIYIQNNTPYIRKLEYGSYTDKMETEKTINGMSKQAPAGMVDVTLLNADRYFNAAVKAVNSEMDGKV